MNLAIISRALIGLAFLGMASGANATLILRPTTDGVKTSGASSCNEACVESIFGASGIDLLYEANDGDSDEGDYRRSYDTDFESNDTRASIDWDDDERDIDCGYCYLVVRRDHGNGYYFFDLNDPDNSWDLRWNGREELEWRGSTDIDRVQIYGGGKKVKVPEPATLSVFGLSLLAFGFVRRRKRA